MQLYDISLYIDSGGMKICTEQCISQCISQQPMMIDERYRGLEQQRDCASAQMQKECDKKRQIWISADACKFIFSMAAAVSTFLCLCWQKCIKRK